MRYVIGILILICGICDFSLPAFAGSFPNFSNGGGGDWTAGYYRPISVTNSTGAALVDYQVCITLTTAALGNPYTHIKADGSDIRFSNNFNGAEIPYWIESWVITGTSNLWVKVPNLPTGDSTIYMYYGNISATSVSSGTNTFVFFDDFNRADSSTVGNGWTQDSGFGAISGNTLVITQGATTGWKVRRTLPVSDNLRFGVCAKNSAYQYTYPLLFQGASNKYFGFSFGDVGIAAVIYLNSVNWQATGVSYTPGVYKTMDMVYLFATNLVNYYVGGWSNTNVSGYARTDALGVFGFDTYTNTVNMNIAWVRVSKYTSPEPSVAAPGAEQVCISKYVYTANWTSIVKAANPVAMGNAVAVISFTAVAAGTITTAHWRRFRIDETGGQPIEKLSVSVYEESGNDGFFDAADKFIAAGTFNSNRTCYLNMNRWPIGTTAKTYYIVEKVALDGSGGATIRINIVDGSYFDFEEGPCIGVSP